MKCVYETHLHTVEGSACGQTGGRFYIEAYRKLGYAGIFITDHFYHGNTRVDRSLQWDKWVEAYMKGYEAAKEEGDRVGFPVFFGMEENFEGDEYLIYGIDKAWLLAHPELRNVNRKELFELVEQAGGLMIQAHPFRQRDYISEINLGKEYCHGIEAVNSGNTPGDNQMGIAYGRNFGLTVQAGSDIHNVSNVRPGIAATVFQTPLLSETDFVKRMKGAEKPEISYDTWNTRGEVNLYLSAFIWDNGKKEVKKETVEGWIGEEK